MLVTALAQKYNVHAEVTTKLVEVQLRKWTPTASIKQCDKTVGTLVKENTSPHHTAFLDPHAIAHIEIAGSNLPCYEDVSPAKHDHTKPILNEYKWAVLTMHNGKKFDIELDSLPALGINKKF